jgi:hypothetical protein
VSAASLVERIRADLVDFGIKLDESEDPSVLAFEAGGTPGTWHCYVWVRDRESQVIVHGVAPWAVPEPAREAVALYLTRANYGLVLGNFELDLDSGELRFKTSIDFGGGDLALEQVRRLVAANLRAMERYLPGVIEVVDGAEPRLAVERAEQAR